MRVKRQLIDGMVEEKLLAQLIVRLDKLDEKIDGLASTMARYDERLQAGNSKFERLEFRLDHIENRVNSAENALAGMGGKSIVFERGGWIVFAAAVALLTKFGGIN